MSTTATEQVMTKNLDSPIDIGYSSIWSSNIGMPMHKGSPPPPSHMEDSPSSIGSNSSINSTTSGNGLIVQNPTSSFPSVKYYDNNHMDRSGGGTLIGTRSDLRREDSVTVGFNSTVPMAAVNQIQTTILAQAESNPSSSINDISDLLAASSNHQAIHNRQLLFSPSAMQTEENNGTYINWLYDLYSPSSMGSSLVNSGSHKLEKMRNGGSVSLSSVGNQQQSMGGSPELGSVMQSSPPSSLGAQDVKMDVDFPKEPTTVFRAQEKYLVVLGAPTSIAQRHGEDTLTYLNKGQFYSIFFRANTSLTLPNAVKSIIHLSFLDEPDRRVEFSHWQYWYYLQANPHQRSFDIDRKNCEGLSEKPIDLAYNAACFKWNPEKGAKVVFRINCLSTEFSSQKGVKGLPLHIVVDTYEDLEMEKEPVHRVYCRVKIFRDKGAERKNKDETKTVERRLQKYIRSQQGVSLDTEIGPSAVFHPPCKETVLTPTSTFGQKPTLFNPPSSTIGDRDAKGVPIPFSSKSQPQDLSLSCSPSGASPSTTSMICNKANFIASIREREIKRTFTKTLTQTKEDLLQLEVGPKYKSMKVPTNPVITIYVKKEEEKVYNALLLDDPTVDGLKLQISKKYDVPVEMIRYAYKKTKKGLIVRFEDDMVARFTDEDDFIIEIEFDNQKGHFDLYILY